MQLSQVGALRFGQLALCQGQKATSEDIRPYLQPSTLASKSSCLLLAEPSLRGPFSPIVLWDVAWEGGDPSGMPVSPRKYSWDPAQPKTLSGSFNSA